MGGKESNSIKLLSIIEEQQTKKEKEKEKNEIF